MEPADPCRPFIAEPYSFYVNNRCTLLDRSHGVSQHETRHCESDFPAFYARETTVDTSKHAGIVDFEKCCEKLDKVRQTPGILSESIGSAFSYAARAWKD